MNAFAVAMDALFADVNLGLDATWYPAGGAPQPIRVIRKAPDEVTSFRSAQILSETTLVDARVSEMANPRPGDGISIGTENFTIQGEPKRDRDRLIWTVELVPA
ncbi:hypothetical protein [Roseovarius sp.]|uniref:head-tail joining protein n=1 Tax=Roseovarius sp. TaxID=1486281 RepID=UPI0026170825|nr:hypothetical protein [Roseovarius sp.]